MVGPGRLELPTPRLSSVCSNQLSYGPNLWQMASRKGAIAANTRQNKQKAPKAIRYRLLPFAQTQGSAKSFDEERETLNGGDCITQANQTEA